MLLLDTPRFSIKIDHLSPDQLNWFGWYEIDRKGPVGLYIRYRDGAMQYIHDGPPKRMLVDDVNDAQQMSESGSEIVVTPDAE